MRLEIAPAEFAERHVHQVYLCRELEEFHREMVRCADPGRGIVDLAWTALRVGDQFLDRICGQRRMHNKRKRPHRGLNDGSEALDGVVDHRLHQADVSRERWVSSYHQRMAIRGGAHNRLRSDAAAGPGLVVNDHRLPEPGLQFFGNYSRNDIGPGSRRKRHDDRNGTPQFLRLTVRAGQHSEQRRQKAHDAPTPRGPP